jgi:GNAT superfamily N-acetyltransferase
MTGSESGGVQLTGYFPGVVGKITELHAIYYFENWGFDVSFETQVGKELSDFIGNFQGTRDGFWVALIHGAFAGSVVIDGRRAAEQGARLRWFIVPIEFQGQGVGSLLLGAAIDFCREVGHKKIFLWTFEGLNAARRLYVRAGFRLCEEHRVYRWGQNITEQMFVLNL